VSDPLQQIFGLAAPELFTSRELVARHGALERFPSFMREGALESIESLCKSYVGSVEVAKGSVVEGIQTAVNGVHPTALLKLGLTVFFSDLRRALPKSNEWLRQLETSLGLPECASMMAFANAAGSGLSLHHDRYDQLFFQIRGSKRFQYAPNGYVENPDVQFSPYGPAHPDFGRSYRRGFPLTSEEVLKKQFQTVELQPGSAFFMPSGTWHTTAEQPSDSLSLVVAVRAPSYLEVLQNLLGYYASQSGLTSSRVYMAGFAVRHGDFVAASLALPNGCPATAGPVAPQATIFLLPQTDSETVGNPILNRNATWTGQGWAISLTDGTGAPTTSNVVAEVYCLYP